MKRKIIIFFILILSMGCAKKNNKKYIENLKNLNEKKIRLDDNFFNMYEELYFIKNKEILVLQRNGAGIDIRHVKEDKVIDEINSYFSERNKIKKYNLDEKLKNFILESEEIGWFDELLYREKEHE